MENLKKTLSSGSEIEIFLADFPDGHRLYKAIARELSKYDLADGTAENLALVLTSSEDIDAALWPCMKNCLYTGHGYEKQKLSAELFGKKAEIRTDLVDIQREVLGFNLLPFSKPIGSLLVAALTKSMPIPRSQST